MAEEKCFHVVLENEDHSRKIIGWTESNPMDFENAARHIGMELIENKTVGHRRKAIKFISSNYSLNEGCSLHLTYTTQKPQDPKVHRIADFHDLLKALEPNYKRYISGRRPF